MHIEHVAIWCQDLERMRAFYQHYLGADANDKYTNARGFSSYFLRFPASSCRLELMQWPEVHEPFHRHPSQLHLDIQLGGRL